MTKATVTSETTFTFSEQQVRDLVVDYLNSQHGLDVEANALKIKIGHYRDSDGDPYRALESISLTVPSNEVQKS